MRTISQRRHISKSVWAGGLASVNISATFRLSSGGSSTKAPRLLGTGPSLITSLSTARSSVSGSLNTPACVTFVVGDAAFVGDTLFMPDYGTARADFPGGDAHVLFRSIRKVLSLPPETRLFLCHDYKAPGRDEFLWETTVAAERDCNVHVHDGVTEDEFVAMRKARDAQLGMPRLILPSIQVNMRAGELPPPEENGQRYLKIPLNML